jgi:hypothetical protein
MAGQGRPGFGALHVRIAPIVCEKFSSLLLPLPPSRDDGAHALVGDTIASEPRGTWWCRGDQRGLGGLGPPSC